MWQGARPFVVLGRDDTCRATTSLWLGPQDGRALPPFTPGQFVTVTARPGGKPTCFSLSAAPDARRWRITVKDQAPDERPPRRVSSLLARGARRGELLQLDAPAGRFVLPPGLDPVVLVAGGVGVMPFVAILEAAARTRDPRPFVVVLGMRRRDEHPLRTELAAAVAALPSARLHVVYSQPGPGEVQGRDFDRRGRVDVALLQTLLPPADRPYGFWLCGPAPMLVDLVEGLAALGVPRSAVRVEVFGRSTVRLLRGVVGPAQAPPPAGSLAVTFTRSGKEVAWDPAAETLLGLAERSRVPIPSACLAGRCGTCMTPLTSGSVRYLVEPTFGALRPGSCLPCVAVPASSPGSISLDA